MSHKRPWYWPAFGLIALLAYCAVLPASGNQDDDGLSANEERLLTDFLILAVKPDGDDKDYKLVEIGKTKIDAGLLGVVINTLPLDFLGLGSSDGERTYDPAAEAGQCRAACAANGLCRSFAYVPPNARQQLGVCHLKTLAEASFGVMAPVAGPGERAPGRVVFEAPVTATPAQPTHPREKIPPPPRLPPVTVEAFPMPPRVVAEAPPLNLNPPPPIVEETPPPPQPHATLAAEPVVAPAPVHTRKPLPVWIALGALAFLLGGAALYRYSHRKRMLTRVTTRLVSNGLDRHTVAVAGPDRPDIGLRFVVRQAAAVGAPGTHIDLIPAGAFA